MVGYLLGDAVGVAFGGAYGDGIDASNVLWRMPDMVAHHLLGVGMFRFALVDRTLVGTIVITTIGECLPAVSGAFQAQKWLARRTGRESPRAMAAIRLCRWVGILAIRLPLWTFLLRRALWKELQRKTRPRGEGEPEHNGDGLLALGFSCLALVYSLDAFWLFKLAQTEMGLSNYFALTKIIACTCTLCVRLSRMAE